MFIGFQKILPVETGFLEILRVKNGQKTQKTPKNGLKSQFPEKYFFETSGGNPYILLLSRVEKHLYYLNPFSNLVRPLNFGIYGDFREKSRFFAIFRDFSLYLAIFLPDISL